MEAKAEGKAAPTTSCKLRRNASSTWEYRAEFNEKPSNNKKFDNESNKLTSKKSVFLFIC
jgi:hypothetical protein